MNIRKLLLIIICVNITGIFFAMDLKRLQAGRPLTHADIIHAMLEEKEPFSSKDPAVDYNGKIYILKHNSKSTYEDHDIQTFRYRLERPINFLSINYITDTVLFFRGIKNINADNETKANFLVNPENIKGSFTQIHEINYRNIVKAGILLAAGAALVNRYALAEAQI